MEKRKFDRESPKCQVKVRMDDGSSQIFISPTSLRAPISPVSIPQSVYIEEVSDEEMSDIQVLPSH